MPNLRKELRGFIEFHKEVVESLVDKLLHLSIEVDETEVSEPPIVSITRTDTHETPWYAEASIKEKFHHTLTDKSGVTHNVLIEVNNQLCNENYYSIISRVIQIHDAGVSSKKNQYLFLSSATLEQVITKDSLVIIASIDDEPIAYALLNEIPNDPDGAREILIEVVPHMRNEGVATALFFATLEHPGCLPEHIEAEIESMNSPVLKLLRKAQEEGFIRYTLKMRGSSTQAHIEIVHPEETT